MADKESRSGGRKLIAGVILIALVTTIAVISYRRYEVRRASPEPAPNPSQAAVPARPAPQPVPVPLAPPPPLTRTDLLSAAAAAASAYAAGESPKDSVSPLVGRRFRLVLPFGCSGPRDPTEDSAAFWEYGPERKTIRVQVRPEDWTGSDFARGLGADVERVEGFWIRRPWLLSESCPSVAPDPLAAEAAVPSAQTVGLARVYEREESRVSQRGERPYEVILPAPEDESAPAPAGYRLVLEGRVVGFEDGGPVACRSSSPEQRPVCLIGVEIERVTISQPGSSANLGEWRR